MSILQEHSASTALRTYCSTAGKSLLTKQTKVTLLERVQYIGHLRSDIVQFIGVLTYLP